jgi:hypothetical protein
VNVVSDVEQERADVMRELAMIERDLQVLGAGPRRGLARTATYRQKLESEKASLLRSKARLTVLLEELG